MTNLLELQQSIGATAFRSQNLDRISVDRFAVALGVEDGQGGVPALGHWAFFHDIVPDSKVGRDGHPARGEFLPALPTLPRRMFAAARITFDMPLMIGEDAEMRLCIIDVRHKHGRSGDMVFVDVERTILQQGVSRIVEVQTYVYRAADSSPVSLPVPAADVGGAQGAIGSWTPRAVNLFRFSAATFNGHRIHYDLPYTTAVEGYPALVVQGPFVAARLAALAARRGAFAAFEFRAVAPGFVDQPIRLVETAPGELMALRCDDVVMMTAKAEYR